LFKTCVAMKFVDDDDDDDISKLLTVNDISHRFHHHNARGLHSG